MADRNGLQYYELVVLLAVLRLGREAYGVPISDEISEHTGRSVLLGTVYATLARLEKRSLLTSSVGEATPVRGGRAKTFFRLTAAGLRQVREAQQALEALWDGLPQLRKTQP